MKIKDFYRVRNSRKYGLMISLSKCWHSEHGNCVDVCFVFLNLEYIFYICKNETKG